MDREHHDHEWLSLLEVSGPFLAVPVLENAFPQGLEGLDPWKKKDLRQAYDEWREALDLDDPQLPELHRAWVDLVLKQGLELDEGILKPADALPSEFEYRHPEYGITLRPNYAVVDDQKGDQPLMLICVYDPDVDLDGALEGDVWAASPAERMAQLCRATDTRLGLVTNGERWMLVDAPVGGVSTYASWYARLWSHEPATLRAFVTLLGIGRFFCERERQLPALLDESLQHQDEVTEALGEQVRRAVEVLVQALDRADLDRNRKLLRGVEPAELYEAALTVMMRLVFLLSAEERELMDVVKDERFQAHYAVSSLRMQLREQAGLHSEEILSHRRDAWSRLLAIFRAVYGGIDHETLRMPALGGSLFDPDRFPFLEGRTKGTSWKVDEARPLPIDNRTILLLLDSIQLFQGRTLSYRALDVENIGYVYEGLLERTVERAKTVVLELDATKSAKKPCVSLEELEEVRQKGQDSVEELLKERTGSAIRRIRNDLKKPVDSDDIARLLTACRNDRNLCDRIAPYFYLLRIDRWGYPLVYPKGAFMITTGSDRRETGTHYTPKSLTEAIVKEALEPVVYIGPAEGKPREEWKLKSSAKLLDLKICDPAMGSGAFLVQVCRWLSERLLEAWEQAEEAGKTITVDGEVVDDLGTAEPLSTDSEERLVTARRLIAERCIYGVDINPMAVELAKLSIWLVTLAKGRPFGFLDHNLRAGDSLLGIHDLNQLRSLDMDPTRRGSGRKLFAQAIDNAVDDAIELRKRLRQRVIRDIHDVEIMAELDKEARHRLELPELVADVLVAEVLAAGGKEVDTTSLAIEVGRTIEGEAEAIDVLRRKARDGLSTDLPSGRPPRHPMHWPLEFPEVFASNKSGFSALIGNPPFLGGRRITYRHSEKLLSFLKSWLHGPAGTTDLCVYFLLRASVLVNGNGYIGLILSDIVSQGESRANGLERLISDGFSIYSCISSMEWPGLAGVKISRIHISKLEWHGYVNINGISSSGEITSYLQNSNDQAESSPKKLVSNNKICFSGHYLMGQGFVLTASEMTRLVRMNPKNAEVIFPYIRGDDINNNPIQTSRLYAINFSMRELSECERDYPECVALVRELVKLERDIVKRKANRERWWRYAEARPGLEAKILELETVIVQPFTAKYIFPTFVVAKSVFAHPIVVIVKPSFHVYTCLQSSIHEKWVWQYCSTSLELLRYTASSVLSTFPFPVDSAATKDIGKEYYMCRQHLLESQQIGLTKIYNRLHDKSDMSSEIIGLRDLHCALDNTVVLAYGWSDIDLEHGFHETRQGIRFSISEKAKQGVLQRLSQLNRERYEDEVAQGLHPSKKSAKKKSTPRKKRQSATIYEIPSYSNRDISKAAESPSPQMDIFAHLSNSQSLEQKGNQWGSESIDQILAWLEAHPGWYGKQAILSGCQADPNGWNDAINELIKDGFIEMRNDNGLIECRNVQAQGD